MINLLVLTSGGQHPQVYTQLQILSNGELADTKEMARSQGFLQMRTVREKTLRSLAMAYVLFPAYVLAYVKCHFAVVRPFILKTAPLDEPEMANEPLIVHSESGLDLITPQVTKTFKRFLTVSEPILADTTVMVPRSSYGNLMMKSFQKRKYSQLTTRILFWKSWPGR